MGAHPSPYLAYSKLLPSHPAGIAISVTPLLFHCFLLFQELESGTSHVLSISAAHDIGSGQILLGVKGKVILPESAGLEDSSHMKSLMLACDFSTHGARTASAKLEREMFASDSTKMLSFGLQEESGVSPTVRAFKDRVLGAAVISMQKS